MNSTQSASPAFVMDPSPDGGVDLFRKAPRGFVLVDTFDTPAAARTVIDEFCGNARESNPVNRTRPAAA